MKKREYMAAVKAAGFEFRLWLDILPTGHKLTNPVPIVQIPADAKPPAGFVFRHPTFFYVAGHHHPVGTRIVALVHLTPE